MDYQNPRIASIYELANPPGPDTEFYLSLAGTQQCNVLDLGCGTGTLCCSLAERGHRVTGVDPAAAMLVLAKGKTYADEVEWVECSAQSYRSHRHFDLIVMTGHAFQILLSDADILAVFETMRRHLMGNGRVAFETRNPGLDWLGEWHGRARVLSGGRIVETLRITGTEGEFMSLQTSYQAPDVILTTDSTLRFPSLEHIKALIARSGLAVRDVFGDWNAGSFDAALSREMIFVAERSR